MLKIEITLVITDFLKSFVDVFRNELIQEEIGPQMVFRRSSDKRRKIICLVSSLVSTDSFGNVKKINIVYIKIITK